MLDDVREHGARHAAVEVEGEKVARRHEVHERRRDAARGRRRRRVSALDDAQSERARAYEYNAIMLNAACGKLAWLNEAPIIDV